MQSREDVTAFLHSISSPVLVCTAVRGMIAAVVGSASSGNNSTEDTVAQTSVEAVQACWGLCEYIWVSNQ